MSEKSSVKIIAQSNKIIAFNLQNNQHRFLQEVVTNCV